ncbi:Ac transposase, putative [Rhizoctonia solani AG-3 Rhs1AP]|uniref:Ac transposase, putative n=1 Tax=Rhizoctonia solani AG-3 Rhs1AP TaxID=1086054 RepID=X8IZ42_9AGAM|nr:Ac transposase, putative [Rhizoctonia solani AG-3 Rhs1AP]
MIIYLQPALEDHLVEANAIRNRVVNHASAIRQQTQHYLNNISGLMAIACDAWTSANRIAFLAITASWITQEWQLEETLLDFVELKGAHDGQNMATSVATVVSELGIEDKVLALVSDNASNNGTLVQHLSSSLQKSAPNSRWDGTQGHVRCLAHIIHLAVMSLLRGVKAVPASVNSRDITHNDHSLTSDEAELIVADDNFEASESDDKALPDPMIDLGSGIDKTIDALTNHPKIKIYRPYALSTGDWLAISAVRKWLKFFRRALVRISGEKYPTLSFSLHIYFVLIGYVSELENDSTVRQNLPALNGIRACKSKLQEFLDRSTKDSHYYYFAMVLDPRYKDTLV